jgi:hypothetical protein
MPLRSFLRTERFDRAAWAVEVLASHDHDNIIIKEVLGRESHERAVWVEGIRMHFRCRAADDGLKRV